MDIPESYKNTTCCINCRKLDVVYAQNAPNDYVTRNCRECNKHVYIYNEMPIRNSKSVVQQLVVSVAVIIGILRNEEPDIIFFASAIVIIFFFWLYSHESDKIKSIESIMKEHLEKDFIVSNKNVIEEENNEEAAFEAWKSEYLAKDLARKYLSDKDIMETYLNQKA